MRKILVINPIASDRWDDADRKLLQMKADPETEIDLISLEKGPLTIESFTEEAYAAPEILNIARDKQDEYQGIMVNCFADPALPALRELCDIPVTGPCESAMQMALMLGHSFSVIAITKKMVPMFSRKARIMGLSERLNSIRYIDIHVQDLEENSEQTVSRIVEEITAAAVGKTEVAILGCTGMMPLAEKVREKIEIPLIEPASAALKTLESMIDLGITHSKVGLYSEANLQNIHGY